MDSKKINEKYQIKVNRISSENEKLYPNTTQLKKKYHHIKNSPQKKRYVYKLKLKPEIIINEYHQTSNNINTNINIKTNRSEKSNNDTTINSFNFNHQPNNFRKYYYSEYENTNPKKSENNDKYGVNKSYKNRLNLRKKVYNNSESNIIINEKTNKNTLSFSPLYKENKENNDKRDNEYKKRDLNYMKNNNYNSLNKYNRISDCIFQSLIDNTKNNKNNAILEKYNYLGVGTTKNDHNFRHKKNNSQEAIRSTNIPNINSNRNSSLNTITYSFKTNIIMPQSSIHSKMNEVVFSSGNKLSDIFRNQLNKNNNNLITKNDKDDKKEDNKEYLNIKLEYYRIKLFKEFIKHFQLFYKSYIKNYINDFFIYLKEYKKNRFKYNNSFVYNRKSYLKNYNSNENTNTIQSNINKNSDHSLNLIELFKQSIMNNNYKLYNQLKESKIINSNITKVLNNYSLHKDINNSDSNMNNSISINSNNNYNLTYNINSAPRINKNLSNYNFKNNRGKQYLFTSTSKSPSIRIGNKSFINSDISFGVEGNNNENKLYRNSNELKKKYEQIQRRKQKSHNKNGDFSLNQSKDVTINKSLDIDSIKNSNEYSEFVELRKYVQRLKSKRKMNQSALNINHNTNNKKNNEDTVSNNIYDKKIFSYNKKENNDNNKKINIDRERIIGILNKEKEELSNNNYYYTQKSVDKTKNNIYKKKDLSRNDNEDKNYQKVRVNINKRFLRNNNVNKNDNNNNKINNNYNYRIIKNTPIQNSPSQNTNIYYKNKNTNYKFTPILIKNISTKDKRININIYYYKLPLYNKSINNNFNYLSRAYNCSICLLGEDINANKNNNNISKLKFKLPSIKEEEISNQNSKFYDESGTFDKNNTYESKKNFINQQN